MSLRHIKLQLAELILSKLEERYGSNPELKVEGLQQALEKPPQTELGDYALPCFRMAKSLRKAPQQIAQELAAALSESSDGWVKSAGAAGAFLNLKVDYQRLMQGFLPQAFEGSRPVFMQDRSAVRTMVEFSQPNTHKEFHIGHVRNVCLGDSLVRLMRYARYSVMPVNYIGDEGIHIAKCLWRLDAIGMNPAAGETKVALLGRAYAEADRMLGEANEAQKAEIHAKLSAILAEIEAKSGPYFERWRETRQWSLDDFDRIYRLLSVHFDHFFYESEVSEESQLIVDEYLEKGVFIHSEGAVGIDLSADKLGFLILRKRDGNTLYATKDLVLHRVKFEQYKIDRSTVVVADEQKHHFEQVFKTLEHMGFAQAQHCHHLSYGMVVRPEGKMSSRKGNSVRFEELLAALEEGVAAAMTKHKGVWPEEKFQETVRKLATGALKYGMISSDPALRIVFDLEAWLSFEGNTGPYLMYAYARTKSILRKAAEQGIEPKFDPTLLAGTQAERDLIRYLYDLDESAHAAAEHAKPSILCGHIYYMCKAFNKYYIETPILKQGATPEAQARVYLLTCFARSLDTGLRLLGIEAPEEM